MHFLKRIRRLFGMYQIGIFKIAKKISLEKNIGFKDAVSQINLAKKYNCGCKEYYSTGIYKLRYKYKMKRLKEIDKQHIIDLIKSETKKNENEINLLINYAEKNFFIDYKQFYQKKFYIYSKSMCIKKIKRDRKIVAIDIAEIMNTSIDDSLERMIKICNELEISYITYYKEKYYKKHEMDILVALPWRKEYLYELGNIVVKETGEEYKNVVRRMDFFKSRYGILYSTYVLKMYYNLTEREIINDLNDYVQMVSDETGWTYNEAQAKMNLLKNKYNISYSRYCYSRYFSVEEQEAYETEKKYKDDRYNLILNKAEEYKVSIRTLYEKMRLHCIRYGDPEDYYFAKNFFNMHEEEKEKYLHGRDGDYILPRKYNTEEGYNLLFNKHEFNALFSKQLGRKWWMNTKTNNLNSFLDFQEGLNEIFIKPIESSRGRGCRKMSLDGVDKETLYKELISSNERLLIEECIKPHAVITRLGGGSVSSIRFIALKYNEKIHLITAYLRVGNGDVTDNISVDGVAIEIDVKSGVTISNGVNKDGDIFEKDLFSGIDLKGIKIPYWSETLDLINETMDVLEDKIGYAGLDIAISEKGPVLIEANSHAHLHRIEFFENKKHGNRYLIERFL